MIDYYLDKKAINILKVLCIFILFVIYIAIIYVLYYINERFPKLFLTNNEFDIFKIVVNSVTIAMIILAAYTVFFYLTIFQKTAMVSLDRKNIFFQKGVIYRRTDFLPLDKVVYFSEIKIAVLSKLGCNFAVLNSVGGRLFIPFLSEKNMNEISEFISANAEEI